MIIVQLPRAGLANKLIIWAHGFVLANKLNDRLIVRGWIHLQFGPFWRKEKSYRFYYNSFRKKTVYDYLLIFASLFKTRSFIKPDELHSFSYKKNQVYIIHHLPGHYDLFTNIKPYRIEVRKAFYNYLNRKIITKAQRYADPFLAIHVRMGDFVQVSDEEFLHSSMSRTPLSYFKDIIKNIRTIMGKEVPVTIFSNGSVDELGELLNMDNVSLFESEHDIIDIIVMSRAKIIATSAGSTFGLWAGFISEAILIHPPKHVNITRSDLNVFEGPVTEKLNKWPEELIHQLKNEIIE